MKQRSLNSLAIIFGAVLWQAGLVPASTQAEITYSWANFVGQPGGYGNADGPGSAARFNLPRSVAVDSAGNVYVADSGNDSIRKITPAGVATTLAGNPEYLNFRAVGSTNGTGSAARFAIPAGVAVDSAGNVYVADSANNLIREVTPAGVVTTMAGSGTGQFGSADGTGSTAQFGTPSGVAVDSAGNVYVADTYNNTIRKVTPAGAVTTVAGSAGNSGSADGTGTVARFNGPLSVAVDSAGNVYVADTGNNTIRKVTPAGVVTTMAGTVSNTGAYADGTGSAALFDTPSGVAVDASGNVFVADTNNQSIRKVTPAGVVTTVAGREQQFYYPAGVAVDSAGNLYVADTYNNTIRKVTLAPAWVVTTVAGSAGSTGSTDAPGYLARFNSPRGVAVDSAGNVYVADYWNYTIRKMTPAGEMTTLAGSPGNAGSADGTGSAARFGSSINTSVTGVAVDSAGNVYVADEGNNTIRKVTPAGEVTTLAGKANDAGGYVDGTGTAAYFNGPTGVAVDSAGNVYVADTVNEVIRKVTPAGVVTTLAGSAGNYGSADGTGSTARFDEPFDIAVDSAGNVYVSDTANNTIRKVTPAGEVTTLAGNPAFDQHGFAVGGAADGTGSAAQFNGPYGLTVDSAGNVFVADYGNNTIRKVTPAGVVTTLAGSAGQTGHADGITSAARFNQPTGVAVDSAGNLYVADTGNSTIRRVALTPVWGVATLAGRVASSGSADGLGSAAQFFGPNGIAVDSADNLFVVDQENATIRQVTPAGLVTTLAGYPRGPGSADGTGSAAQFLSPVGAAVDSADNVFVGDAHNNTIRKVTPAGVVTTLAGSAGTGNFGSVDGTGSAARFDIPAGVAVDSSGNVYVADDDNQTIRKVSPTGVVTTLAGSAGYNGHADGTGSAARFFDPIGVAVDSAGNLFVADSANHTIRKVTPAGAVTTLAGSPGNFGSADGTGSAARFFYPYGIAVDSADNVYVADTDNETIRKITPAGVVTTIGGLAGISGGEDGTGSAANFSYPTGITVDSAGNIYITDAGNNRITKGTPSGVSAPTVATPTIVPVGGTFTNSATVTLTCATTGATIRYTTDGTMPTASSPVYNNPFQVTSTGSVNAQAFLAGDTDSAIASAAFTIVAAASAVATPKITPPGGTFSNEVKVTISCATAGATIRYTMVIAGPATSSLLYRNAAITLTNSLTLTAQASKTIKNKIINSGVATAVFAIIPPPPLTITTTSLPAGKFKVNYPAGVKVQATGGTTPYKWSLATGKLPTGMTLNATTGAITGKPTKLGTFPFTVKATDAKKQTATQVFSVVITAS